MTDAQWKTKIAGLVGDEVVVRGHRITELIKEKSLPAAIFLVLSGREPEEREEELFESMLVACLEHGINTPSVLAARIVRSGGNSLNTAVGAGVLAIGDYHGGAIESAAYTLKGAVEDGIEPEKLVEQYKNEGKRLPGYGHKKYETDPRSVALFEKARGLDFDGKYIKYAEELEVALEKSAGRKLCLNVDGAIAALMLELGLDPALGKGIFIIGRVTGLVAHAVEEAKEEKPFRTLPEEDTSYDG